MADAGAVEKLSHCCITQTCEKLRFRPRDIAIVTGRHYRTTFQDNIDDQSSGKP